MYRVSGRTAGLLLGGLSAALLAACNVDSVANPEPQRPLLAPSRAQSLGQPVRGQDLRRPGGEDLVGLAQLRRQVVEDGIGGHALSVPGRSPRADDPPP